jgi:uncharacterized protein (TIGR00645 family)
MKSLEAFVERVIFASRWILVVFYAGLGAALFIYAISFGMKFYKVAINMPSMTDADMILSMLALIDAALVASLLVMVMLSSYENFVSRFDQSANEVAWLGKLNSGSLKIKVAASIVAISSIHLLQVFLNIDQYTSEKVMWLTILHVTFVISALLMGFLEKIMHTIKDH